MQLNLELGVLELLRPVGRKTWSAIGGNGKRSSAAIDRTGCRRRATGVRSDELDGPLVVREEAQADGGLRQSMGRGRSVTCEGSSGENTLRENRYVVQYWRERYGHALFVVMCNGHTV